MKDLILEPPVWFTVALVVLLLIVVVGWTLAGLPKRVKSIAGRKLPEAHLHYTPPCIEKFLGKLYRKRDGIDMYRRQLRWDFLFIFIVVGLLWLLLLGSWWRVFHPSGVALDWLILAALILLVADWAEDLLLLFATERLKFETRPANEDLRTPHAGCGPDGDEPCERCMQDRDEQPCVVKIERTGAVYFARVCTAIKWASLVVASGLVVLGWLGALVRVEIEPVRIGATSAPQPPSTLPLGGDDLTSLAVCLSIFLLLYGAAMPWAPAFVRLPLHVITLAALLATASYSGVDLGFVMPGGWQWLLVLPVALPVIASVFAWVRPGRVSSRHVRCWRARSGWLFLFEIFPRLIVTTVLLEEVAFRGLLFGAAREAWGGYWPAALVSSLVFGLWHISPTLVEARDHGVPVTTSLIVIRVIATTLFGLGLAFVRDAGDSLWLPIAVHWAFNAAGMVAAFIASRRIPEEAI